MGALWPTASAGRTRDPSWGVQTRRRLGFEDCRGKLAIPHGEFKLGHLGGQRLIGKPRDPSWGVQTWERCGRQQARAGPRDPSWGVQTRRRLGFEDCRGKLAIPHGEFKRSRFRSTALRSCPRDPSWGVQTRVFVRYVAKVAARDPSWGVQTKPDAKGNGGKMTSRSLMGSSNWKLERWLRIIDNLAIPHGEFKRVAARRLQASCRISRSLMGSSNPLP